MSAAMREVPQPTRLAVARQAEGEILAALADINAEMQRVDVNATESTATGAAQSARQQRNGLLARLLRIGKVDADSPDLKALDKQVAAAEHAEQRAVAIAEARKLALAGLQAEADQLNARLPAARRELAEAELEAARVDVERNAIPRFLAAAEAMRAAYAELAGAGAAHHDLARELRERHGVHAGAIGQERPAARIGIAPIPGGFGISNTGGHNQLAFDVGPAIAAAQAEALHRWRQA